MSTWRVILTASKFAVTVNERGCVRISAMRTLILASNSPRRSELLRLLGLPFEVHPADIAEVRSPGEPPVDYVLRLARHKAAAIAEDQPGLVIAADTTVVDGDELLEKPADPAMPVGCCSSCAAGCTRSIPALPSWMHIPGSSYDAVCCTQVPMRDYSDAEIDAYIATGDPLDKAGAYGIQHTGFHPVEGLRGCFASVMGLPLCHLLVGLQTFAVDIPGGLPDRCQAYLNYDCPAYQAILGRS
jgi:septum formation protein